MIFRVQRVVMGMALATVSCHFALADDISCEEIADETVIEMKAGANDWWSEDIARMAGMAAASACFKTRSRLTTAPKEIQIRIRRGVRRFHGFKGQTAERSAES